VLEAPAAIEGRPARTTPEAGAVQYEMTSPLGDIFQCAVPPPPQIADAGSTLGTLQKRVHKLLSDLLMRSSSKPCASQLLGYWHYSACFNGPVQQWHAGNELYPLSLGSVASAADSVESAPEGGPLYYVQRFEGGSGGRSSSVRWRCATGGANNSQVKMLSVAEPSLLSYTVTMSVASTALCELLPSATALLAPLNGTCIEHLTAGWWSYEVCVGGSVKQFHAENGVRSQVQLLGQYNWTFGERVFAPWEGIGVEHGGGQGARGVSALSQVYSGGGPCNVKGGEPRMAIVRFECMPAGSGLRGEVRPSSIKLLQMEENPTCSYAFSFGTPLACKHPLISPSDIFAGAPYTAELICSKKDEEGEQTKKEGE
jgi:Glucosidase II beta subunit-like protein